MRTKSVFLLALAGALCFALASRAQDEEADTAAPRDQVPDEVLVKIGTGAPFKAMVMSTLGSGAMHAACAISICICVMLQAEN